MKILAIDIGAGTQDILLYDDRKKSLENCFKMVLPSPCQVFGKKIRKITELGMDLVIKGDTIGGGPLSYALKQHIKAGFKIFMTEGAAYTVRNNLMQVEEIGIKIVSEAKIGNIKGYPIFFREINIDKFSGFLKEFEEKFFDIDYVAIAVQDHGVFPPGMSNREFRLNKLKELLLRNPKPEVFAFKENQIPSCFLRMRSTVQASKNQLPNAKVLVMDTSPDAILGCLMDPVIKDHDPILVVNLGNGHTMAAIISNGYVIGLLEHHTRLLNPKKLSLLLKNFVDGKLTNEQVFNDNGHGMFYLKKPPGYSCIEKIVATGPNRNIIKKTNLPVHFATPAGDMMMSGPIGLIEATKRMYIKNNLV
jgi:uncharacterized protein (DUF1786 family)